MGAVEELHADAARDRSLERLAGEHHDVLVVGGGINGAVSALALAAHDLRVGLVEAGDFGSGVSQESSNLIWGGFKYLQNYEVGLVAKLCRSRNLLARSYPSRLREVRFVAALGDTSPYSPAWAALGANAYWALGRFRTRRPRRLPAHRLSTVEPSIGADRVRGGIEYSDYLLADNDSRFVMNLLLDATERGAEAVSRIRLQHAERTSESWRAGVTDLLTGEDHTISATVLINAAGPGVPELAKLCGVSLRQGLCFSKGAHLVVPQVTASGRVLAFFDDDRRLFYVLPMGDRSVIGTTDARVDEATAEGAAADRDFLLAQANARLALDRPLRGDDVIACRCGVRPLVVRPGEDTDRDWTELSRRHAVEVDTDRGAVSILGGKLSDCLNVGSEVLAAARACGLRPSATTGAWYGEPPPAERDRFGRAAAGAGLEGAAAAALWRRHGRRALEVTDLVRGDPALGEPLSGRVEHSAAEVMVMARHEHVLSMEDFLRRRTMLAMLETAETLKRDPGVERAADLLFGSGP